VSAPAIDRIDSMGGRQRHSSTLQQLLAWEKKLYKDVKVNKQLLPQRHIDIVSYSTTDCLTARTM
jgi:hypothetical protein